MTKAVFFLPPSFSWMFSADKLFASKTKPGEISLLLKSSVGSLSLIFISLFSRFILPLRPIGIKWLLKLCKHTLPYRSSPCIDSENVCVCFRVCLCLFMHAWQHCTCTGVWSHYESETLGQGSSAHSAHLPHCALTTVSVFVCVCLRLCAYVCILHYVCLHVLMCWCAVCLWFCIFIFMRVNILAYGSECIYIL